MKTKFLETVRKFNMFSEGDRVIVALSGGADSMTLVSLLYEFRNELGIRVEAAHVNHSIRDVEADGDADFVAEFCKRKNIVLHSVKVNIPELSAESGESIELCARRVRYEFFDSLMADKIATAHTGSDRIETFLMNLSRGATLNGLCSIPATRGKIVRPLIAFTRDEIETYCKLNNIDYVTDSSNLTNEYTRNKFRHNIVAELKSINPSFENNALRCIDSLNLDKEFFDSEVSYYLKTAKNSDGTLNVAKFENLHEVLVLRIIASYVAEYISSDYEMKHIRYIYANLNNNFALTLHDGVIIKGDGNKLGFLSPDKLNNCSNDEPIVVNKGENIELTFRNHKIQLMYSDTKPVDYSDQYFVDADKILDKIYIRNRLPGDLIHLSNRNCTKSLKKLFNEMKVPEYKRSEILIISDSDGIIYLDKVGLDSTRLCNKNTKNFLLIRIGDVKNG